MALAATNKGTSDREAVLIKIRSHLLARREEILKASSECIKNRIGLAAQTQEIKDEVDCANATHNLWMDTIHSNKRNNELLQIDNALLRIKDGAYGICEECGEEIPEKRLQARPFAAMCVGCQEEKENAGKLHRTGRCIIDEVTDEES